LLGNFRLLEAAGACGVIAHLSDDCASMKPSDWWEATADGARTYRRVIHRMIGQGLSAVDDWSNWGPPGADADLTRERTRLCLEHRRWLCEVTGGRAYSAWLSAYVAAAELDGERALRGLDSCAAIVREFVEVPELGNDLCVYEFLQSAADALPLFLPLTAHPLSDARRFAFLPSPLRTGYGS
jgi:hypothetical protein